MNSLKLEKIKSVEGRVDLPGSKSMSNRALLLSALAQGKTQLLNVLKSDDTECMLNALEALGIKLASRGNSVEIEGRGGTFASGLNRIRLHLGNAGTAMRPLCAVLALSEGVFELTGEPRMLERPIGPLVEALKSIGLHLEYLNNDGFPPLLIRGGKPTSHELSVDGALSSQFITALLLASPLCGGLKIKIKSELISKPYVDLTIALMKNFGIEVQRSGYKSFETRGGVYLSPGSCLIEGDATSATYFAAAAAVSGRVEIFGLGKNSPQGDALFMDILERMGAGVTKTDNSIIVEHRGPLKGLEIDMNDMPDAAMTLVPLALYTQGPVTVTKIASWRVKETDRIVALSTEMSRLGVKVSSGQDYICVDASSRNTETPVFNTYNDHRIAMCMSLIALDRSIVINNPECVAKTFPNYFNVLSSISKS